MHNRNPTIAQTAPLLKKEKLDLDANLGKAESSLIGSNSHREKQASVTISAFHPQHRRRATADGFHRQSNVYSVTVAYDRTCKRILDGARRIPEHCITTSKRGLKIVTTSLSLLS